MYSINMKKLQELILNYYKQHIHEIAKQFENILIEEFSAIVGEVPLGWIAKGTQDIITMEPVFENGELYCNVGWNYNSDWENARIMVALHGNHDYKSAIKVKPFEATWQDDLFDERYHNPDKEELEPYPIPQFDRRGIDALDNAIKRFQPIYDDMIKQLEDSMPIIDFIEQCMS